MNRTGWVRYGWVLVLLAVAALWLRVENIPFQSPAKGAPIASKPDETPLTPTTAGIVDMAVIFKNYAKFKDDLDVIRKEVEAYDAEVKRATQEFKDLEAVMKKVAPGSNEESFLKAQLLEQVKSRQERTTQKKAEFLAAEAEAYRVRYADVQTAIKTVARKRNVNLVLRFNRDELKPGDRDSILQGVNRAVVYYSESHDITDSVLDALNQP